MAKYTVLMSCGHEQLVNLYGKEKDRQARIEYLESHGLCNECYKKKIREQKKKEGLTFHIYVQPRVNQETGQILVTAWFGGDTWPHKESIKALGYRWDENIAAWDDDRDIPFNWIKVIPLDNLKEEIEKAKSIGASVKIKEDAKICAVDYSIALSKQKEWKEKQEQIKALERPTVPLIVKGKRWNDKVYGREGYYSVYLDSEKVKIDDGQAEELREYVKQEAEYLKKKESILNQKKERKRIYEWGK